MATPIEIFGLKVKGRMDFEDGLSLGGTAVTATAAELNALDGITASVSELNLVDGLTPGTVTASKAVIAGAAKQIDLDGGAMSTGALVIESDSRLADGVDLALGTVSGSKIGTLSTHKIAFCGGTPASRRTGASQGVVATTAAFSTASNYGFTSTQANGVLNQLTEIRATLVALGLWKGSA